MSACCHYSDIKLDQLKYLLEQILPTMLKLCCICDQKMYMQLTDMTVSH